MTEEEVVMTGEAGDERPEVVAVGASCWECRKEEAWSLEVMGGLYYLLPLVTRWEVVLPFRSPSLLINDSPRTVYSSIKDA